MDPLGGVRSKTAQAQAVQRGVRSQVSMAKSAQSRTARWDRKLFLHLLLFLFLGLVLATMAFIEFFGKYEGSVPQAVFLATAAGCFLAGILHDAWLAKRSEGWRSPGPELLITLATLLFLGGGVFLGHYFYPGIFATLGTGEPRFAWILSLAAIAMLIPFLVRSAFDAAMDFEPRRYELWFYPKNFKEKEPTYVDGAVVMVNVHFRRREQEEFLAKVNAKFPAQGLLGEWIYLFIEDYNTRGNPGAPIQDLSRSDGSLGWTFKSARFVFPKRRKWPNGTRVLDPALTVGENGIVSGSDIYFERVIQRASADE